MVQALPVYATAALLLVASAGPVLSGVRDASLADFEALNKPRPLSEFPFLKEVRPYLPPLVVEWLIVNKGQPFDLPPGADFYVDPNGRVIYVFPDGCQESQQSFRSGSDCQTTDCTDPTNADHPDCDPCKDPANRTALECAPPPPECPGGQIADYNQTQTEWRCAEDPECADPDGDGRVPEGCPIVPPPPPTCDDDEVEAYDGTCIQVITILLRSTTFAGAEGDTWSGPFELKVPFANLSMDIDVAGTFPPDFDITLSYASPTDDVLCWVPEDEPSAACDTTITETGSSGSERYLDAHDGPIPRGNLTLTIEYSPTVLGQAPQEASLSVRLFGKPHDADAET